MRQPSNAANAPRDLYLRQTNASGVHEVLRNPFHVSREFMNPSGQRVVAYSRPGAEPVDFGMSPTSEKFNIEINENRDDNRGVELRGLIPATPFW